MFTNRYCLGGLPVEITTQYSLPLLSLKDYETDEPAVIRLEITPEDLSAEIEASEYKSSPAYLETLAVQRKLSEALVDHDTILFHASALAMDGEGFLFAALSGTGKSTHSRLWREVYKDRVTMINDDKPFIRIGENEVRVYGSPWDGKHHLSTNTSVPVKAICILTRDTVNHIEKIRPEDAFSVLFQQTYRSKDPVKLAKTIDLIIRMTGIVSLYRLGCNMDPEAAVVSYEGMK